MSRTKVTDEQKRKTAQKAVSRYHKEHMKIYSFRFNVDNQRDIIEQLESQENKAGYVADLIRQDLIAKGKKPYVRQRVCDIVKDISDKDVVILTFKDGSSMVGGKNDFLTDERIVEDEVLQDKINYLVHIITVRYS